MKFLGTFFAGLLLAGAAQAQVLPERHEGRVAQVAEDVADFFGSSTEFVAGLVHEITSKHGEPDAVIKGSEGGGAVVAGYRQGRGVLEFNGEQSQIFWRGVSVGFDFGGNGSKVYMLVYKLRDKQELYRKFGAAEGVVYYVAGGGAQLGGAKLSAKDTDIVIVPIRLGVGWRQGINYGYVRFAPLKHW